MCQTFEDLSNDVKHVVESEEIKDLIVGAAYEDWEDLSTEEWVDMWMNQKDLSDRKATCKEEECQICLTNAISAQIDGCHCKQPFSCATCLLKHYYIASDRTKLLHAQCPMCNKEYTVLDVQPTKESFIKRYRALGTMGKAPCGYKGTCFICRKEKANAVRTCCKTHKDVSGKIRFVPFKATRWHY